MKKLTKLNAIKYLHDHSAYNDEWSGAGMWEAVEKVLKSRGEIDPHWLDELLVIAANR